MHLLFETTPDGAGRYIDWILSGLVWTLSLAFGAWAIALVVGTLVGVARTIKGGIWPRLGRVYVETFRNIPLLVQMFFWYFVLPEILPQRIGFARAGLYRLILLPQAFRIILPTLTNEFMTIFKNTSVALTIGLVELTATAREINENTFRTFEAYGVVTLVYLVIALLAWSLMYWIERAAQLPSFVSGARGNDV